MFKARSNCVPSLTTLKVSVYTDDDTANQVLQGLQALPGILSVDNAEHIWKPARRYNITADYWDPKRLGRQIGSVLNKYSNVQYLIGGIQHVHVGVVDAKDPKHTITAMVALGLDTGLEEWLLGLPESEGVLCYAGSRVISDEAVLVDSEMATRVPRPDWLAVDVIESWGYIETQTIVSGKPFKESTRQVYSFYKTLDSFD